VEIPGVGGGGEVFADYRSVIHSIYWHAWAAPENSSSRSTWPVVSIVVARDGTILSQEIVKPSGETILDRSVRRALDSVPHLPPFPAGATDAERTFRIQFSLDLKESSG
jgi:TonB family protein